MEKTHNLEVVGSSPTWSTLKIKHLQSFVGAFSFVCEQFANKTAIYEYQYKLLANTASLILFAKASIFVRKAFFDVLFSNISNLFK